MFLNSIDSKPLFVRPDGNIIRDLTETMFNLLNRNSVSFNVFRVPREYVMRPDLISKVVYNNTIYAEMILKYNGISNPFSINEGDYILIPNLEGAQANVRKVDTNMAGSGANKIRNTYKYIDPKKAPKKGQELSDFENRDLTGTAKNNTGAGGIGGDGTGAGTGAGTGTNLLQQGALPPNIAPEGSSQITYRNGRVYFGESVANCLKSGSSTSEFLTTVIRSHSQN